MGCFDLARHTLFLTAPSPFVEMNEDLEEKPFGAPGLGEFVASQPREAAVRV